VLHVRHVDTEVGEGGEEVTVSKVVKKTTKTSVVSSTEGRLHRSLNAVVISIVVS